MMFYHSTINRTVESKQIFELKMNGNPQDYSNEFTAVLVFLHESLIFIIFML